MLEDTQIHRLLDIANTGCQKGFVTDARAIYDGVLELRPNHAPALIGMAFSHIVVDEFEAAEKILNQVLAAHPDDTDAQVCLGLCYTLAGKTDEAKKTLTPLREQQGSIGTLAMNLLEKLG